MWKSQLVAANSHKLTPIFEVRMCTGTTSIMDTTVTATFEPLQHARNWHNRNGKLMASLPSISEHANLVVALETLNPSRLLQSPTIVSAPQSSIRTYSVSPPLASAAIRRFASIVRSHHGVFRRLVGRRSLGRSVSQIVSNIWFALQVREKLSLDYDAC